MAADGGARGGGEGGRWGRAHAHSHSLLHSPHTLTRTHTQLAARLRKHTHTYTLALAHTLAQVAPCANYPPPIDAYCLLPVAYIARWTHVNCVVGATVIPSRFGDATRVTQPCERIIYTSASANILLATIERKFNPTYVINIKDVHVRCGLVSGHFR